MGMILETSVERARGLVQTGGWREATTRRGCFPREEERQSQAPVWAGKRACSGPTLRVILFEGANLNANMTLQS